MLDRRSTQGSLSGASQRLSQISTLDTCSSSSRCRMLPGISRQHRDGQVTGWSIETRRSDWPLDRLSLYHAIESEISTGRCCQCSGAQEVPANRAEAATRKRYLQSRPAGSDKCNRSCCQHLASVSASGRPLHVLSVWTGSAKTVYSAGRWKLLVVAWDIKSLAGPTSCRSAETLGPGSLLQGRW
jgi:hypothetical protein